MKSHLCHQMPDRFSPAGHPSWLRIATIALAFAFPFSLPAHTEGAELEGAAPEQVLAKWGEPAGRLQGGGGEIWVYAEHRIIFRENTVRRVEARTPVQTDNRLTEEAERRARERAANHRLRGEMLRTSVLQDAAFLALPGGERRAFWTAFQKRHPDIDVSVELASAREDALREARARTLREEADKSSQTPHPPLSMRGSGSHLGELERRMGFPVVWAPLPARRIWREPEPIEPALPPTPDKSLRARTFRETEDARREAFREISGH
ncbi:MAG: hypothetical protein JJT96_19910 [Opitutales bacterium]|nr:hypothetical protein [Opitutales bacterium]